MVNGFRALATDFDGTIAHDGIVDAGTPQRASHAGRTCLVTGRELATCSARSRGICSIVVAEQG